MNISNPNSVSLEVPDGFVLVAFERGYYSLKGYRVVNREEASKLLLRQGERVKVMPASWIEEVRRIAARQEREAVEIEVQFETAPEFELHVTLKPSAAHAAASALFATAAAAAGLGVLKSAE